MWKHNVKSLKYHFSNILVRCTEIKPMKIRYRTLMSIGSAIDVHPNIRNKILSGNPVVALESTIITHGMPYPQNLETAIKVEEIVKSEGSTPATIAVINGRIKIGLEKHHLEQLALDKNNTNVIKCSTRDLLYAVSKGISGGTTVAATLFVANKLGIKVFATGGIGGVHRDGQNTFDISADLIELGKSPMAVICSGVKSILDIQKTLEFLETHGVCVATYQVPDFEFPAFYTRKSGCKAPYNMENSEEAAEFIHSLLKIESKSGILLAVPIPEKDSIAGDLINNAIKNALNKCKENKIFGKNITPFVLQAVANITEGKSLEANISLIQNNARVASQIAVKLHKLLPSANGKSSIFVKETPFECSTHRISSKSYLKNQIRESGGVDRIEDIDDNSKIPIVIGASVIDINIKVQDDFKLDGATYFSETKICGGGVGRNIAEGIWKQFGKVNFISVIGNNEMGENIIKNIPPKYTKYVRRLKTCATSICNVVVDKNGECKVVFGDMKIHNEISFPEVCKNKSLKNAPIIVMDANIAKETMKRVLETSKEYKIPVFYEPSDMRIADKPFTLGSIFTDQIKFISPNIFELQAISKSIKGESMDFLNTKILENKEETMQVAKKLLNDVNGNFDCVILTLGSFGVIVSGPLDIQHTFFDNDLIYKGKPDTLIKNFYFEAPKIHNIVNVSGAGDSFCSGFISAMLKRDTLKNCVLNGFSGAKDALLSEDAVPEHYTLVAENLKYYEIF